MKWICNEQQGKVKIVGGEVKFMYTIYNPFVLIFWDIYNPRKKLGYKSFDTGVKTMFTNENVE